MMRKVLPGGLVAAALMLTAGPGLACPEHGGGGSGSGSGSDCCAEEGAKDGKKPDGQQDACCEAMDGDKGKGKHEGRHGMRDRQGMRGHHGMMGGMMRGLMIGPEIRYMPVFGTATNQWLVLSGELGKRKNDWFSVSMQRNLAIQTFNNGPAGFWVAPYGGILPKVGYTVGEARADLGVLAGVGAMARTANVGTTADVLQARLMWVVEPRVELMWQGEGHGVGVVATYLVTQHLNDLGGFSFGLKGTWGGKGHGGGGKRHGDKPGHHGGGHGGHGGHGGQGHQGGDGHQH
ncbi:MAG: hypothetical protein ACK46X_13025 [Candidatus Sericytochromatia bacterium]